MTPRGRLLTDAEREALILEARALAPDATLRPFCEEHAALLGCHPSTVYRVIRPHVRKERQRRSDAGDLRALEQGALEEMAALVAQFDYDAELAIDTLNANRARAGDEPLDIHPETLRRHLRRLGVSRRENAQDLRVHRRWEAPHPNYLWQMDSTVAASWYIDTDDTVGYEAPIHRGKNKAGNQKPRIWLIGLVDDYSRVTWARFYTANSALAWRDLLVRAMRKGAFGDPLEWPAYGIPERVYTDQDSAMKSAVMVRTLELLEVERMLAEHSTEHETNAQAKGKVERGLGLLIHGFEKTCRGQRFESLDRMNRMLGKYLIYKNNRPHSETGVAPFERFLEAGSVIQLPPEEIMRRVLYRKEVRTVQPDVTIRLEGKTYQLPRRAPFVDHIRKKVDVLYFEADLSKITVVLAGEEHEVPAVEAVPDRAGEFQQAETPAAVKLKRELLEKDLSHLDLHAVHDYRVERDPRSYPVRSPEEQHPITAEAMAPRMVRRGKAIDRAQKAGVVSVPPTEFERTALKALFADRKELPASELQEWIAARLEAGGEDASAQSKGA